MPWQLAGRVSRLVNGCILVLACTIALATAAVWYRSHKIEDSLGWTWLRNDERKNLIATTISGTFYFEFEQVIPRRPVFRHIPDQRSGEWGQIANPGPFVPPGRFGPLANAYQFAGFGFADTSFSMSGGLRFTYIHVWLPLWALILVSVAVVVVSIRNMRQGRRAGHCRRCGYDLRATPGRCPECGDVPYRQGNKK
jgi:hypothetical protein